MSYGTRKAIAGTMRGCEFAHEGADEFVRRMADANTADEISAVMAWAKDRGGWFLRSSDDNQRMQSALVTARMRVNKTASEVEFRSLQCKRSGHRRTYNPRQGYWQCSECGAILPAQ